MSKRMIDSEVSERIKYRWDDDVEQSYIDIDADNLNVRYINSSGFSTSGSIEPAAISMEINGNYQTMNGRQIANKQLYYHCIKLTSATKSVYVNLNSQASAKCTSKIAFQLLIKGDQGTAPEFYYGAGNSVVHFFKDSTGMHCMIDDEEVTTYEDHTFAVFPSNQVVVG